MEYSRKSNNNNALFQASFYSHTRKKKQINKNSVWQSAEFCDSNKRLGLKKKNNNNNTEMPTQNVYFSVAIRCGV